MDITFEDKLLIEQALRTLRKTKRDHITVIRVLRDSGIYTIADATRRVAELREEHTESVRLTKRMFARGEHLA